MDAVDGVAVVVPGGTTGRTPWLVEEAGAMTLDHPPNVELGQFEDNGLKIGRMNCLQR
jgi:hypothetical protein